MKPESFLSRLLERVGRDRPFTRREQLSLVMASHMGILMGALLIEFIFQLSSGLPIGFVLCEALIIVMAAPFVISFPGFEDLFRFAAGPPPQLHGSDDEAAQREARKKQKVENLAGGVLILASIVQFAALTLLLWGTGGPIESPFAEMTLIIAVFTPFIANNPKTIGVVVAASIVYYATFIFLYAHTHPQPTTLAEMEKALAADPSVWAYFVVNIMILVGGILFTILESMLRNAEMDTAARENSRGGLGSDEGPTDDDEGMQPA